MKPKEVSGNNELKSKLENPDLLIEQCYVAGQWIDADSGETLDVTNPFDGSVIGTVPKMGADETRRAIEAAEKAFPEWKEKTAIERSGIIRRWYELVMENVEDLAIMHFEAVPHEFRDNRASSIPSLDRQSTTAVLSGHDLAE